MADLGPIPVSLTGITTGSAITGTGVWSLVLLIVFWIIKQRPQMAAAKNSADASLRQDLLTRIMTLEKDGALARETCDKQLAEMRLEMNERQQRCDNEINGLRNEVAGLHRQMAQVERSAARRMTGETPPDFEALADKIAEKGARK